MIMAKRRPCQLIQFPNLISQDPFRQIFLLFLLSKYHTFLSPAMGFSLISEQYEMASGYGEVHNMDIARSK